MEDKLIVAMFILGLILVIVCISHNIMFQKIDQIKRDIDVLIGLIRRIKQ